MTLRPLLLIPYLLFAGYTLTGQVSDMSNERLDSLLRIHVDTLDGQLGRWQFVVGETPMFLLTDERHDRMRIISPVKEAANMSEEELQICLAANFHSALDVKYAVSDNLLWVAYIHPLAALKPEQFVDALAQVRSAVVTYGTTYTSTDLVFPLPKHSVQAPTEDERATQRL